MTPEETARIKWNESRKNSPDLRLADDLWMEYYKPLITDSESPVIDLGCGGGYDTEILLEWGMNVISCDYSDVAIDNMRNNYNDKGIDLEKIEESTKPLSSLERVEKTENQFQSY